MDGGGRVEQVVDVQVSGMHCAACVGRVEKALRKVPGVAAADVNLQTERARVRGSAASETLLQAIRTAGYGAQPLRAPAPKTQDGLAAAGALALSAPLLLPMLLLPFGVDASLPPMAQLALAAAVQFGFGARFYRGAWAALRAGTGSMDTLVALGTSAAFGLSLWGLAVGGPLYFEASAAIIAPGAYRQVAGGARQAAGGGGIARPWNGCGPEQARLRRNGAELDVAVAALRPGDLMVVRPGERFPADGIVREGEGQRRRKPADWRGDAGGQTPGQ